MRSGGLTGFWKEQGKDKKPDIRHVVPEDLRNPARLEMLFRQAVTTGLVQNCECDRLRFFAAAEHARAVADRNPCGLFATLVRQQLWHFITQQDEDSARARLKAIDTPLHIVGPKPNADTRAATPKGRDGHGMFLPDPNQTNQAIARRVGGTASTTPTRFSSASQILALVGIR